MGDNIAGATLTPLKVIDTQGGPVLHMLRADSPAFRAFGEVYFSEVEPGAVKAWKRHKRMTQNFAAPVGRLRVVLYDARPDSPTRGTLAVREPGRPDAYALLTIPPGVASAASCMAAPRRCTSVSPSSNSITPAKTTSWVTWLASTIPLPMVEATLVDTMAPAKLRKAAMKMAALTDRARVETQVAMALAVS